MMAPFLSHPKPRNTHLGAVVKVTSVTQQGVLVAPTGGITDTNTEEPVALFLVPTASRRPRRKGSSSAGDRLGHDRFDIVSFAFSPEGREGIAEPDR